MGMQLPGELATLLQDLGFMWPKSDEEKLFHKGGHWLNFGGQLDQPVSNANDHATRVYTQNKGEGVQAFQTSWNGQDSPHKNLLNGTTGATIISAGLMICGGIVLALKINVIVQLVQLAIEIITAATSLVAAAWIPVLKKITSMLINLCLSLAMNAVLG
ncbi:hypothetical protein GCM10023196_084650 [Actinoallomurus vinaceus]|uniref:Outer membrane channel protein CpnT-like N-terminal domain-containing protein n=1 Tax=Actinoallomurus vinaceus TaxID=1080074 RepID=A0ABP8UPB0_9ACTN